MILFKCRNCGKTLQADEHDAFAECPLCSEKNEVPQGNTTETNDQTRTVLRPSVSGSMSQEIPMPLFSAQSSLPKKRNSAVDKIRREMCEKKGLIAAGLSHTVALQSDSK
ncbi:MAG: hypothetical protein IJC45_09060, partial [Clostridia bacterium]|nr:hypothetical protein [Clostridia bacterium]